MTIMYEKDCGEAPQKVAKSGLMPRKMMLMRLKKNCSLWAAAVWSNDYNLYCQ